MIFSICDTFLSSCSILYPLHFTIREGHLHDDPEAREGHAQDLHQGHSQFYDNDEAGARHQRLRQDNHGEERHVKKRVQNVSLLKENTPTPTLIIVQRVL